MFNTLATKLALRKVGLPTTNPFADKPNPFADLSNPFANASNPFANTNFALPKALQSWTGGSTSQAASPREEAPTAPPIVETPKIGDMAPSTRKLRFPAADGRPCIVIFLRYCGDSFAQKTLLTARTLQNRHPSLPITVVSHCTASATHDWLSSLGGAWGLKVIVDEAKEIYSAWGLGQSNTWYVMNPWTQIEVRRLGNDEGIWGGKMGEGGDRWLMAGYWAVDARGKVVCGGRSEKCEEKMDLAGAANVLGFRG